MSLTGIPTVKKNIVNAFNRKKAGLFALSGSYALRAIQDFRAQQAGNKYWENQSNQAKDRMFTNPFIEGDDVGWRMAHGVEYGPYLELSNDRQNEAIRPTMLKFTNSFLEAVRKLY